MKPIIGARALIAKNRFHDLKTRVSGINGILKFEGIKTAPTAVKQKNR